MNDKMDDKIEILISCLEKIHQATDGSCPICEQPDYPVNGEKSGYDEVRSEDAEEYHCDHDADCVVTAIEKLITAWNTHPEPTDSDAVKQAEAYLKAIEPQFCIGDKPISTGHIVALIADNRAMKEQLAENLKIWSDLNQENVNCEDENANLRKQLAEAKKKCDEYHNQYHLCEAKLLSHKAIIKQLTVDVNSAFRDGERITVARLDRKLATKALSDTSPESPCEWKYDEDHYKYDTGCGKAWTFIDDGVEENSVKFCPFCGKLVSERKE